MARRSLNHVKLLVWLVWTDIWRASPSVGSTPSLHGRSSHQIKHLNNYCLICCCGRGACGLIRSRTESETDVSTARFSLLIVRPPGPRVTLTIHNRDFTDSDGMIVELGVDRISLQASLSFWFFVAGAEVPGLAGKCLKLSVCCVVYSSV